MRLQPISKFAILFAGWVQFVPDILAPARWAQTSNTQPGTKACRNFVELVQLCKTIPCQHTINSEAVLLCREQFQATQGSLENTFAPYAIICLRSTTVQTDLKIEWLKLLETTCTV